MSPQPAASNANAAAERPHDALLSRIEDKQENKEPLTGVERQVARAMSLEGQRGTIMKQINANREYLRLMEENGELDDDDEAAAWLDDFYPLKEKGQTRSEDEIERTRKVKAAARA